MSGARCDHWRSPCRSFSASLQIDNEELPARAITGRKYNGRLARINSGNLSLKKKLYWLLRGERGW